MDFLTRLEMLMRMKGVNKSELAEGSGIKKTTVYSWWDKGFEGITLPKLKALSAYFGCTLDWLVCGDEYESSIDALSPDENRLLSSYRSMTKEGKEKVQAYISDMLMLYQNEKNESIPSQGSIA